MCNQQFCLTLLFGAILLVADATVVDAQGFIVKNKRIANATDEKARFYLAGRASHTFVLHFTGIAMAVAAATTDVDIYVRDASNNRLIARDTSPAKHAQCRWQPSGPSIYRVTVHNYSRHITVVQFAHNGRNDRVVMKGIGPTNASNKLLAPGIFNQPISKGELP